MASSAFSEHQLVCFAAEPEVANRSLGVFLLSLSSKKDRDGNAALLFPLPLEFFAAKRPQEPRPFSELGKADSGVDLDSSRNSSRFSCAICLANYRSTRKIRKLSCGHFFHSRCCEKWTKNHRSCPLCRGRA